MVESHALEIQANFFRDYCAAGKDGDIFEHCLAAITEARCLTGSYFNNATQVVYHQGCQGFTLNIFGNNHQRLASFGDIFQQRQQLANIGDLLVYQQDKRAVLFGAHVLLVGNEVR